MIFRNDDVSPSTDRQKIDRIYSFLLSEFPGCEIWSCINIFGRFNTIGSVYPDLPLKDRSMDYLYDVDSLVHEQLLNDPRSRAVSHGLIHSVHSRMGYEAQEMSIVMSCKFLGTDIFVPPFNAYNEDTIMICEKHGIRLVRPSDGWLSIETSPFFAGHDLWFFHGWRYKTADDFIKSVMAKKPIGGDGLWWLR